MDISRLMQQAKKMQMELEKKQKEFDQKEFIKEKQYITIKMNGNLDLLDIKIKPDIIDPEDKESLEDIMVLSINELIQEIKKEKESVVASIAPGASIPGLF